MKTKFPAYYRIHKEDVLDKFDDCIFMFDTSSLLDVFRLKKDLAEKVFEVLSHYIDQVQIPYHVAEEYNKDIHTVLKEQLSNIERSKDSFKAFLKTFDAKRSMPYIGAKSKKILESLERQIDKDYSEQEKYVKDQLLHGSYQNRMAELLDGRVLEPFTEAEIKAIETEGATRYSNKIPPGYKDAAKGDNRYGDLINWKEILRFAKNSDKNIVFVANDEKEDWICKENGMKICPLYSLLSEFYRETGTNSRFFHICTLDRFLGIVNEKDNQVVSTDIVQEVKDYLDSPVENLFIDFYSGLSSDLSGGKVPYILEANSPEAGRKILGTMQNINLQLNRSISPAGDKIETIFKKGLDTLEDKEITPDKSREDDFKVEKRKCIEESADKIQSQDVKEKQG